MKSFPVNYKNLNDEVIETIYVKRVRAKDRSDLIELQQELLAKFAYYDIGIGTLLTDSSTVSLMEKICNLMPLVGTDEKLDLFLETRKVAGQEIEIYPLVEDIEQICNIFFTTSMNEEGEVIIIDNKLEPSLISKVNHLDYQGDLGNASVKAQMKKFEERSLISQQLQAQEIQMPT